MATVLLVVLIRLFVLLITLVQIYSTVGVRVPICLRNKLLKTCTASFFPSKSILCKFRSSKSNKPLLYTSWLSCATMMSDWLLPPPTPNVWIWFYYNLTTFKYLKQGLWVSLKYVGSFSIYYSFEYFLSYLHL